MVKRHFFLLIFLVTGIFSCQIAASVVRAAPADGNPVAEPRESETAPAPGPPALVELNAHLNRLPRRLVDLRRLVAGEGDRQVIEERLPELNRDIERLTWRFDRLRASPLPRYNQLADVVTGFEEVSRRLHVWQDQLERALATLAVEETFWVREKRFVTTWLRGREKDKADQLFAGRAREALGVIGQALDDLRFRLHALADLGKRLAVLDGRIYQQKAELRRLMVTVRKSRFEQTAPPILSPLYYRHLSLAREWNPRQHWLDLVQSVGRYVHERIWAALAALLLVAALSLAIGTSARLVEPASRWFPFTRRPVSAALFLSLSLLLLATLIYSTHYFPLMVEGLLSILLITMIIRLAGILVEPWLYRSLLLPLSWVLILTHLLQVLDVPLAIVHVYIFLVSGLTVIWYLRLMCCHRDRLPRTRRWLMHLTCLVSVVEALAELTGYAELALFLFTASLYTVFAALDIWFLFLFSQGLLGLMFHQAPLRIVRKNSRILAGKCTLPLSVLFLVLFCLVTLVNWQVFPTIHDAAVSLGTLEWTIGGFTLTPGYVLTVFLVIYGSFVVSRMLQALLLQDVLPRYSAQIGVQLAITRLVHYAVLVIGFLVLLKVMGLELSRLALLGGALGVGIGFGLQTIVNNFVSGLILLFERPLKVGDMIQVGEDMGEVRKLGLRATVVRTFDNADIVIPNADLISGQVTNWTLANRKIRVRVPVGVAYGSDIATVMKILEQCAEDNPMVLSQPRPRALFLAFGASSLDFELRVWVADFANRRSVLSELNQEIEAEFSNAGIEIPFPQTDIHLRSLDPAVADRFRDPGAPVS